MDGENYMIMDRGMGYGRSLRETRVRDATRKIFERMLRHPAQHRGLPFRFVSPSELTENGFCVDSNMFAAHFILRHRSYRHHISPATPLH